MKKILFIILGLALFLLPIIVLAAVPPQIPPEKITWQTPENIVKKILDVVAIVVLTFGTIMILYAGFKFMTAGGDAEKIKKAKTTLVYGLIGLTVALFAYGAKTLIEVFLGAR